jgi:aspartate racemase
LGPLATSYFMEMVIRMTDAQSDYEHIPMVIYNKPNTPDRTKYILDKNAESPLDTMISVGKVLERQGVDYIAIPCVTAYYFYEELTEKINVPIINIISETADYLKKRNVRKVGIMATDGTIAGGFLKQGMENLGIRVFEPSGKCQDKLMGIIYDGIKAGEPFDSNDFFMVEKELRDKGAEVIVLGCTELSLIHKYYDIGKGFLDAMEVLAQKSVLLCSGKLKRNCYELIT